MDTSYRDTQSLEGLLAGMDESLREGLVPARIFNDETVHRTELERIFTRTWTFLGHESEIPSNGDYVLRYIGEDAFILIRDEHGEVRVLFDACRHRGTQLCRAEKGNTSHFRCPYHGWTYRNTGEFLSAPAFASAYGGLDKSQWGLVSAAAVDTLHGLIFATLDPAAPSLDEYLGGMRWYLDIVFGLSAGGVEVIGEPNRWVMDADWKSGADNFAGDDYHTVFLHRSMFEIGAFAIPPFANLMGYHVQAAPGHSLSFSIASSDDEPGPAFWGYPEEVIATFDTSVVTPEQFDIARRARVTVGTVFPNLSILVAPLTGNPDEEPPVGIMTIRQWQPKGPGRMEIWNWCLAWKGTSEEQREAAYRASVGTFSASGLFEQDDTEPWQSIARTGGSAFGRTRNFDLHYAMGMEGVGTARRVDDWPGPGVAYWPRYEEGAQRNFYDFWLKQMRTAPAAHAGNGHAGAGQVRP